MTNQGNSFGNPPVPPFERDQEEAYLTGDDKKHFEADIDAMNVILLGIPNDIYNYVDACKTAQAMWQRVKRLMQGTDLSKHKLTSRFLDEFDKFKGIPGESIESYKYVTMVRQSKNLHEVDYDELHDYLKQNEINMNASRAKRVVRTHDPLALVANHYAVPSSSYRSPSYYVTHPLSVNDFDGDNQ
ncbi:hypothetical protein Tco_1448162 [Tanacetum coccineum]